MAKLFTGHLITLLLQVSKSPHQTRYIKDIKAYKSERISDWIKWPAVIIPI